MLETILQSIRDDDAENFRAALDASPEQILTKVEEPYANWFSGLGASLLQLVAFVRPTFARELTKRGARVDLHSACALDLPEIVEQQLAEGADLQEPVAGFFPIQFALRSPACLRLLLDAGAKATQPVSRLGWFDWEEAAAQSGLTNWRPLHMVALARGEGPHTEVARLLTEYGAPLLDFSKPFGNAPIHLSAIYARTGLLRWFVERGCSVDLPSSGTNQLPEWTLFETKYFEPFFESYAVTPLMLAAGEGHSDAVQCLLELGADLDCTDSQGFTALHYAAGSFWQEQPAILKHLIDAGASQERKSLAGLRPLDIAQSKLYPQCVDLLTP